MKQFIFLLLCCGCLVACTPGTANAPQATIPATLEQSVVPTEPALPTLTPEPSATPTIVPTAIPATDIPATATSAPEPTATTEALPEPVSGDLAAYPADLLITFRQEGGFAGLQLEWVIEASGRVTQNGAELAPLTPEQVAGIYQALLDNDFFNLAPNYKAEEICCDFITYTLIVTANGQTTTALTVGGPPDTPEWLWNCLQPILTVVGQAPVQ